MPVIRPAGREGPIATVKEHLADLLVKELMGERIRYGPVIFELPTERPDRVDVIVCWEDWKSLPVEARHDVVRNAYARFRKILESTVHHGDPDQRSGPLGPTPASVTAISWEDLTEMDLLPYKVSPRKGLDEDDDEGARLLMLKTGAIWTPLGPQLRLPTEEMAVDAKNRLMALMPEAEWSIDESTFGPIMEGFPNITSSFGS